MSMKRIFRIILALALALCMAACGRQKAAETAIVPSPAPAALKPALSIKIEPTPAATPDPLGKLRAEEGVYTIAWISDTQYYSRSYPETFYAMTAFLSKYAEEMALQYVVHTGDLVNNYDDEAQWQIASEAMARLDPIPYGVLAGNHDVHHKDADYTFFSRCFGEDRFSSQPTFGESYKDNRCHYDIVPIGDMRFLFVYLGYQPTRAQMDWANKVFARYPGYVGILCVHDYFTTDALLSETGELLYRKVVAKNPNLYFVLCGHRYNQLCIRTDIDDTGDGVSDRRVYQLMCNYQAAGDEGGSGYMRFLQIHPQKREIRVYSYSPVTRDFTYFDDPLHQTEKYTADPGGEEYVLPFPW